MMQKRSEIAGIALGFPAIIILGPLGPMAVAMATAPNRAQDAWCGESIARDWACGRHGVSWLGQSPLLVRVPHRLSPSAVIATAQGGSARVALRAEADCTIGTGSQASKVVARPEAGVLLRQLSGETSCGTPHRSGLELCTETGCNIQLETEGVMLASLLSEEATASDYLHEQVVHHRVRIVSCSGFISVSSPGGFASGGATGSNRYVVEIDDYTYSRESETTTETPAGTTIQAEASSGAGSKIVQSTELPGRGPCKANFVREEERDQRP
jgi:hypothetical protein